MAARLTKKQREIFEYIESTVEKRNFPPSIREIAEAFNISDPTAFQHLGAIEKKGHIRRKPRSARAIHLIKREKSRMVNVPILGRVAAGVPTLAEQNIEGYLAVDGQLVKRKKVFTVQVSGDSMIGAGILDKDYVIARHQPTANSGEIVVARLEHEVTVKRLRQKGRKWFLVPENPNYQPIPFEGNDAQIQGKVIEVRRSYEGRENR